jgi:hypothetical protein
VQETPVQTFDLVNVVNKKQVKASITNAIAKLVTGSNRDEIALRVEETIRETSYRRERFCPYSISYGGLC